LVSVRTLYTKTIPLLIVSLLIIIAIGAYYFGSQAPQLRSVSDTAQLWNTVITGWVYIYSSVGLVLWHIRRLRRGRERAGTRAFFETCLMLGTFIGVGLLAAIYGGVDAVRNSTFLLAMSYMSYTISASQHWLHDGYESFRRVVVKNVETLGFFFAYISGMAYQVPAIVAVFPQIEPISIWFEDVAAKCVQRGGILSMAIFSLMMIIRATIFKEPGLIEMETAEVEAKK